MSTKFSYVWMASWDFIANDHPGDDAAFPEKLTAAFNFISVGWRREGENPSLPDTTHDVLKPWLRNGEGSVPDLVAGGKFYAVTVVPPAAGNPPVTVSWASRQQQAGVTPLFRNPGFDCDPQIVEGAGKILEKLRQHHGRTLDRFLQEMGPVQSDPVEPADHTWSAALAGSSNLGFPASHALGLCHWLDVADSESAWPERGGNAPWQIVIPEKLGGLTAADIIIHAPKSDGETLQVEVVYRQTEDGKPDIVLYVNTNKLSTGGDVLLTKPFVGVPQTIDASSFTNWLGTLPATLGRFMDLVWMKRASQVPEAKRKADVLPLAKDLYDVWVSENGVGMFNEVLGGSTPAQLLERAALDEFLQVLRKWPLENQDEEKKRRALKALKLLKVYVKPVQPALKLLRSFVTLGLPLPKNGGAAVGAKDRALLVMEVRASMAYNILSAVAERKAEARNGGKALHELLKELFEGGKLDELSSPAPEGTDEDYEMLLWTQEVLLRALKDVDGKSEGGSHSGHYHELSQWVDWAAAERLPMIMSRRLQETFARLSGWQILTASDLEEQLKILTSDFVEMEKKAMEQLSRLMEDEEVLRRMFCLQWDIVLNKLRVTKEGAYASWVALLGAPEKVEGSLHMLYGKADGIISDHIQQTHFQFSRRYGDDLAASFLAADLVGALLEGATGELILGVYNDIATDSISITAQNPPPSLEMPPAIWGEFYDTTLLTQVPDIAAWRPGLGEEERAYVIFLLRCAGLILATLPTLPGLDAQQTRSAKAQLFLAAAYLGKVLLRLGEMQSLFGKREPGEPPWVEVLARVLCAPPPAVSPSSAGDRDEDHWKHRPWTWTLTGLDRKDRPAASPPPLPVPCIVSARAYDQERHAGLLVLARRHQGGDGNNSQDAANSWWLLNAGEPIFLDGRKFVTTGKSSPGESKVDKDGTESNWMNAKVDEVSMEWLSEIGSRLEKKGMVAASPWQLNSSQGVAQGFLEYRGKPVSLRLWDDAVDDPLRNSQIPAEGGTGMLPDIHHELVNYQIISGQEDAHTYKNWGPVPGLRYGTQWEYDFLFIPIHNTGALPPVFRKGKTPGDLWDRENDAGEVFSAGMEAAITKHRIRVKNYLRRVPVGQVRLAAPLRPGAARAVYKDYKAPFVPEKVRPLCLDLMDETTREHLARLQPLPLEGEVSALSPEEAAAPARPLAAPSQIVLLRNNARASRGAIERELDPVKRAEMARDSEAVFHVRPPATSVENWTIWQSSQVEKEMEKEPPAVERAANVIDCIADMNRLAQELSLSGAPDFDKSQGLELTQLIDDPAVAGVLLTVTMVLDLRQGKREEVALTSFLSFAAQELAGYTLTSRDPVLIGQKLSEAPVDIRNNCRKMVQTHGKLGAGQGGGDTLRVRWVSRKQNVSFADGVLSIPEGCVAEVALTPCIPVQDWSSSTPGRRRWAHIYKAGDLNPQVEGYYAVSQAVYRMWVETVPHKWEQGTSGPVDPKDHPPYLPDARQVWQALRLTQTGTTAGEARRVPRLEVAVLPQVPLAQEPDKNDNEEFRRWAFVSDVRVEIQPWVWRGLPEGPGLDANGNPKVGTEPGEKDAAATGRALEHAGLSALLWPEKLGSGHDKANGKELSLDERGDVLTSLLKGEIAAFGEREDAASRVQQGVVNYAAAFHMLQDQRPAANSSETGAGPEVKVPPFIIYQDQGEQDEVPRYYRVKLIVNSRYVGFGSIAELDDNKRVVQAIDHEVDVASEHHWDWHHPTKPEKTRRRTKHRRILFRGRLQRALDLPRLKMVIPLLEPVPLESETVSPEGRLRPGFMAVTMETLRSPWHRLVAEVDWARVNTSGEKHDATSTEIATMERPEVGYNVITSGEAFDLTFKSMANLRARGRVTGRAFGLTYEREASDPLFPNAGFYFQPPFLAEEIAKKDVTHDWFAKVAFRWEIGPEYVMDNMADHLVSESTQWWQVQMLAPFHWLKFSQEPGLPLHEVRFALNPEPDGDDLVKITFKQVKDGKVIKDPLGVPQLPKFDVNASRSDASPASVLLFVLWALVPDVLNAERSKVAHSILAYVPGSDRPKVIYLNSHLKGKVGPAGGNFLLLFGRKGDANAFTDALKGHGGLDELVNEYLFPLPPNGNEGGGFTKDAKLMITRCSPPVFAL